jgi:FkbM family methyltransferase
MLSRSFAQAGEDRILEFLFGSMGIKKINYIDIGANQPKSCNNTYLFYCKRGNGVLIEPDPALTKVLQNARPNDKVVQAAISDKSGEAEFFIFDESQISTLSKEEAAVRQQSGRYHLKETISIPLLTIEDIIVKYMNNQLPHLISLDVEGVDFDVLNAFDFEKYPVPVFIVETCSYSETHIKPKINTIIDLMLQRGYFVYADTYINNIFVNKNWFDNYSSKS